jgi:hypothetical protein
MNAVNLIIVIKFNYKHVCKNSRLIFITYEQECFNITNLI